MNDDVVNPQTGLILFRLPFILVGSILGSILIDSHSFPCVEHLHQYKGGNYFSLYQVFIMD